MMHVDVDKHSVESGENLFALRLKGFGEWNVRGDRKQCLVVDLRLNPVHQEVYVLGGGQVNGFFILDSVLKRDMKC